MIVPRPRRPAGGATGRASGGLASPAAGRSMAASSLVLLVGKGAQMGAGMLFWVIAAHTSTVRDVGLATATVAAVMMCTQIALVGAGSAVIAESNRERHEWTGILHTTFTAVTVTSLAIGLAYLAVSARLSPQLHSVLAHPAFVALFLTAALFGTLMICLDQVSVAIDRAAQPAVRYIVSSAATLALLAGVGLGSRAVSAAGLFACWAIGAAIACAIGAVQLRRALGYRFRPSADLRQAVDLLRVGLPNQMLTLAERLPALVVPLLVAEVATPEMSARWYPGWMMAWGVFNAPIMVGLVQFAKTVQRPDQVRSMAISSVRWSLLLGGPLAVIVALAAGPLLGLLGASYAQAAAGGLRVLVIGLAPYALIQSYNAACRATGRLAEAVSVGLVAAIVGVGLTVAAATTGSVTLMATAWVTVSTAVAVVAWVRLRAIAVAVDVAASPSPPSPSPPVPISHREMA
jgi:O-antigen/teichoic acid export membrane protein